ncbi:MAG: hypothetical protein R3B13_10080 [Polyangiaceae bacterium]
MKSLSLSCSPLLLLLLTACSSSEGGDTAGPTVLPSSGGGGGEAGGAVIVGGTGGSGGSAGSEACVAKSEKAELIKQPVDVIVVADTSDSMGKVTNAIELNINTKLTDVLKSAKLDYRVVLIAGYGAGSQICVKAPLGGGTCDPIPAIPEQSPQLLHYDRSTGSKKLISTILATYASPDVHGLAPNGWGEFLRPDAKKVFLAFTDGESGPSGSSATFDTALLGLGSAMFGTVDDRKYVFHTFAGVALQTIPTDPWLPTDPIAPAGCGHPKAQNLQELSMLSGGLRYPLCKTDSYDSVFQAVADDVIEQVKVSCDLPFPTPPNGETLDPDTIQVVYTAGTGGEATFGQVKSQADCTSSTFFVDADTVHLCPDACANVQGDLQAELTVRFGCDVGLVK